MGKIQKRLLAVWILTKCIVAAASAASSVPIRKHTSAGNAVSRVSGSPVRKHKWSGKVGADGAIQVSDVSIDSTPKGSSIIAHSGGQLQSMQVGADSDMQAVTSASTSPSRKHKFSQKALTPSASGSRVLEHNFSGSVATVGDIIKFADSTETVARQSPVPKQRQFLSSGSGPAQAIFSSMSRGSSGQMSRGPSEELDQMREMSGNTFSVHDPEPEEGEVPKSVVEDLVRSTSVSYERCMASILDLAAFEKEVQIEVLQAACRFKYQVLPGTCGDIRGMVGNGVNEIVASQICTAREQEPLQSLAEVKASLLQRATEFIEPTHMEINEANCLKAFDLYDKNLNGNIERTEILGTLHGREGNERSLLSFLLEFDADEDGAITKDECKSSGAQLLAAYHVSNSSDSLIQDAEVSQTLENAFKKKGGSSCSPKTYACYPTMINNQGDILTGEGFVAPGLNRWTAGPNWRAWGGIAQVYVGGFSTKWYNGAGWDHHEPKQSPDADQKATFWCVEWHSCDGPPHKHDIFNAGHFAPWGKYSVADIDMYCGGNTGVWFGQWHENMNCQSGGMGTMKKLGKPGYAVGGWLWVQEEGYDLYTTGDRFEGASGFDKVVAWLTFGREILGAVRR